MPRPGPRSTPDAFSSAAAAGFAAPTLENRTPASSGAAAAERAAPPLENARGNGGGVGPERRRLLRVVVAVGLLVAIPAVVSFNWFKALLKGRVGNTDFLVRLVVAQLKRVDPAERGMMMAEPVAAEEE